MHETSVLEAEKGIIGSMLAESKTINRVLFHLKSAHFQNDFAREAFESVGKANQKAGGIDLITVLDGMDGDQGNKQVFLAECVQVACPWLIGEYIQILKNAHKTKKAMSILQKKIVPSQVGEQLSEICEELGELMREGQQRGAESIAALTAEQYTRLFDRSQFQKRLQTGFKRLDETLKGIYPKNLVIVAARPAVGKSAFSLSLARSFAVQGKKVGLYSLEMGREELYERLIANEAELNLGVIKNRDFDEFQKKRINTAAERLKQYPVYINDSGYQTIQTIRAETRLKGFDVVIVDYLGLISSTKRTNNRNDEVGEITRGLKLMAMDLDIPVIALSQLNRGADETEEPSLRSLRDSGNIEQDANMILFLWKDSEQHENKHKQYIACKVAKNRNGPTNSIVFSYQGCVMTFEETDREVTRKKARREEWQK